jgi:hypothetical protein
MPPYKITGVDVADGPALARNNMSAFWTDTNWILLWPGISLDTLIASATTRIPRNLLSDRVMLRHEKVVDEETGKLVGYARWVLPVSQVVGPDGGARVWPEARVSQVSTEEEKRINKAAESAWWNPSGHMGGLDDPLVAAKMDILAQKDYISKFHAISQQRKHISSSNGLALDFYVAGCDIVSSI